MNIKRTSLLIFLTFLAILVPGCGPATEKVEYTIEMTDFAYTPNTLELKVGQEVTLHLINRGALKHELMAGREAIMENGLATGYTQDMFAGVEPTVKAEGGNDHDDDHASDDHGHGEDHFMVTVAENNGEATMTFIVTEDMVGEWEMGCFLDAGSHYKQGMTGKIIVSP